MKVVEFSTEFLDQLTRQGEASVRRRMHSNIHLTHQEPCQRLFNAICTDSYIRPHRHSEDPKNECMLAIRGILSLVTFTDAGEIDDVIWFGVQDGVESNRMSVGIEVPAGVWHTVIAHSPGSILFEVKAGPFDPTQAKELAGWAPPEGSPEAAQYLAELRAQLAVRR